jgi:23S rRNA (uracil1939-C5)-methyltransferase
MRRRACFKDLDYPRAVALQEGHVAEALARMGGARHCTVRPALPSPAVRGFRNKREIAFSGAGERLALGLHRRASAALVNVEHCALLAEPCMDVLRHARDFCRQVGVPAYDAAHGAGSGDSWCCARSGPTGGLRTSSSTWPGARRRRRARPVRDMLAAFPGPDRGRAFWRATNNTAVDRGERKVAAHASRAGGNACWG